MKRTTTILLCGWLCMQWLQAQPFSINHLSSANGLSDNKVNCVTTDQNGLLWVGTENGLNVYDGYQVRSFFKEQFPGLCNNSITALFCDSKNRIWVGTTSGTTLLDAARRFNPVSLNDSTKTNYRCDIVFETRTLGIIQYTNKGIYYFDEKNEKWVLIPWSTKEKSAFRWRETVPLTDDRFVETGKDKVIILDYKLGKKVFDLSILNSISACRLNDDEIMVALYTGKVARVSISQRKVIKEFTLMTEFDGRISHNEATVIRQAANGQVIVGTAFGGMYIFDPGKETFTQYARNLLEAGAFSTNDISKIFCDRAGNVFLIEPNRRLNYFNILNYKAGTNRVFEDEKQTYDGAINFINQDQKGRFWLGGHDCLIMQDPKNNRSAIYRFYYPVIGSGERPMPINIICFDREQRVWVATHSGIALLNEQTGAFTSFSRDSVFGRPPNFTNNFVYDMLLRPDGKIWMSCYTGLVEFDPYTFKYDTLRNHPVLIQLPKRRIYKLISDDHNNVWMGSSSYGVFHYDGNNNRLTNYSVKNGMLDNDVIAMTRDNDGNVYAATRTGLNVINPAGKIETYTKANGLRYNDCQALLKDSSGSIWIANHAMLINFNPVTRSFTYYNEKDGLSGENFRVNACLRAPDGLLYWGTEKGYTYFSPGKLSSGSAPIHLLIYQADAADSNFRFTASASMSLTRRQNTLSFFFTSVNLYSEKNIFYQYFLEGQDKSWTNSLGNRQVRYNSLSPGTYFFKVRASRDGMNWTESANTINVTIRPAFWQTSWFKLVVVLLVVALVIGLFRRRIGKIKEREALKRVYEKKIAETEMGSLRAQMNPHFMFNSLNSINHFILKNDPENASGYLTKFSRLMRLILDNSRNEWVLLEDELKALQLYIELEALRFDNEFDYHIEVTGDVDTETVMVPPMIIQPFVENAIWHGLLHRKEPGGKLDVHIWKNNGALNIEIEDNGIGRAAAKERKSKSAVKQKSHGMQITAQRLDIVNQLYNINATITIKDLVNHNQKGEGTSVLVTLNYKTQPDHDSNNS